MMLIESQLSHLQLHGMSRSWQALIETRRQHELTLSEGLELLLQAEEQERTNNRFERLRKSARFRYQASVEELNLDASRGVDKGLITALATGKYLSKGESVLITGATGCGKSFLASALGHQACAQGYKVAWYNLQKLLLRTKISRIEGTIFKFFESLAKTDLLILDDFGLTHLEQQQQLDLMEIIEDRHGKSSSIIASQLPVANWYDVIGEETIADAILDRIVHTSYRIELKGESLRKNGKIVSHSSSLNHNPFWGGATSPDKGGQHRRNIQLALCLGLCPECFRFKNIKLGLIIILKKMKKGHIILILSFFGIFNSFCQNKPIPSHGSYEKTPGETWDRGFVSGNGRMGAILYGKPGEEILVTNHCRLYLPLGSREIVPDLSGVVDTMREIYRKNPSSAEKFLTAEAKKQGFNGLVWTDPFHPGMFVKVKQATQGTIRDYQRTEDFSTGEVIVSWKDDRGEYVRKMFVSRPDNLIVVSLAGPTPCELEFEKITHELILSEQKIGKDLITYHNVYKKGKGGYDVAVRIIKKDMGRNTLLLFRIVPWKTPLSPDISEAWANSLSNPDFKACGNFNPKPALTESSVISFLKNEDAKSLIPKLVKSLNSEKSDYSQLLNQHMALHQELFERVRLDLNGGHEREMTTTELLKIADQENRLPAALMEKMYDAGRYMLICSAGETLPNLHGIWTGTWNPVWSGDYTLDTNVQAALASSCSSNLPELLKGYFNIMESYYPEWRINAKRMYGCRGLLTNSRASNTALMLHWGTWDGNYWTAGCGWLASFFTQYSDYTCDETFIRNQCIPLLKDIATFYEDFLVKNKEGEYEFIPSYNPETGAGINSSMDIEVAKEVISNLIRYSKQLNFETQNLAKWEQLMEKLPKLNLKNGILGEFQDGKIESQHRHHSQFYGCYQSFDIAFEKNPVYRIAAQNSLRLKIYGSDYANGEQSSFGRVQSGISAAYLGMPNEAYNRLKVMAVKQSMEPSLITSHEPNQVIFNTDGNGGIPQIVSTMLLQSRPDVIKMLPALPNEWPSGKITGMLAQGGFEVTIEWKEGELKRVLLKSNKGNPTKLIYKEKITTVDLKKGEVKEFLY